MYNSHRKKIYVDDMTEVVTYQESLICVKNLG